MRIEIEQGSPEWHALRKTKLGASTAAVIMGVGFNTPLQLYNEMLELVPPKEATPWMLDGLKYEPAARAWAEAQLGEKFPAAVYVSDETPWLMASLDGISNDEKVVLEIKTPGQKDHALAVNGEIPEKYVYQMQHQMYAVGKHCKLARYCSYDKATGEGVLLDCPRDDKVIKKLLKEEKVFYDCIMTFTPPELIARDYVERDDQSFTTLIWQYDAVCEQERDIENRKKDLRAMIIEACQGQPCACSGYRISCTPRQGNVDYKAIPELKGIDLNPYRGEPTVVWTIRAPKSA